MKKNQKIGRNFAVILIYFVLSGCGVNKTDIQEAQKAAQIFTEFEYAHIITTVKQEGHPVEMSWEYWYDNSAEERYYALQTMYDEAGKERYRIGYLKNDGIVYANMDNMLEGKWKKETKSVISSPSEMFESVFLEEEGQYKKTSRKNLKDGAYQITLVHGEKALKERTRKIQEDPYATNPMEFRDFSFQVLLDKKNQPESFREDFTIYREEHGELKYSYTIQLKALNDTKVLQELEELIQEAGIEP